MHSGTTLNLLKFPIINPTPYRMFQRQERLNASSRQTESELSEQELKTLRHLSRKGYLVGKTGSLFLMFTCSHVLVSSCPHVLVFSYSHVHLSSCPHVLVSSSPGRVGRTFQSAVRAKPDEIDFDPDSLAFGENDDEETKTGEDTERDI